MNRNTKRSMTLWESIKNTALAAALPWRQIVSAAAFAVGGALLSGASAFGVYPFSLALLASAEGFLTAAAALVGGVIGAVAAADFAPSAIAYVLLFLARVTVGVWLNGGEKSPSARGFFTAAVRQGARESVWLRAAFATAAAMASGALSTLWGSAPSIARVIFAAIVTPVAVLAFCTATVGQMRRTQLRDVGVQLFLFAVVRALRDAEGLPFSAGVIAAFAISVMAARGVFSRRGTPGVSDSGRIMTGVLSGVVVGLAQDPGGAPIYAAAALAAGMLFSLSPAIAVMAGWAAASALSFAGGGLISLAAVMPELTVTAALLVPLMHFSLIPAPMREKPVAESAGAAAMTAALSTERADLALSRLRTLSGAFHSLSDTLTALSQKLTRPSLSQLRELCSRSFDARCAACENRVLCRERECAQTDDTVCRLALSLHKEGRLTAALIPPSLAARCHRMDEILTEIEHSFACAARDAREGDHSDIFAEDFSSLSAMLETAAEEAAQSFSEDEETSRRLRRELAAMDFYAGAVTVFGVRRRRILAQDLDLTRLRLGGDEIREAFERLLNVPLSQPEYQIDGEHVSLRMESVPRLAVEEGSFSRAAGENGAPGKKKSPPNGDFVLHFETDDGRYYMLVCDGMGTGGEASVTARLSAAFLEELLCGGAQMSAALTMLNSYLRQRSMECSAGIDLMEIDRYSGEAKFVKSGAAPSFVLRGGRLFRLSSKTAPIGILRALDAEMIRFSLEPGDTVVMLSDGVSENFEDSAWLCDMLASPSVAEDAPDALAQKIVRAAVVAPAHRDDVSAAVVRVA